MGKGEKLRISFIFILIFPPCPDLTFLAELDYLAVHPKYQRRGVASLLTKSGIAQAEKMKIDIFVFGFRAGLGVYQKCGFALLDQLIQDDTMYGGEGEYATFFLD